MKYKTLIVGLGQVAFGYDINSLNENVVLSHARAFATHPAFVLIGGVDPSEQQCAKFSKIYNCDAGSDLISILKQTAPEVVVIAAPTSQHGKLLKMVLEHVNPLAILCEKPLSYDLEEAQSIVKLCHEHNCLLYVNYLRRTEPGAQEIKRRLKNGRIAKPLKGVVWYTKGLLHNGSHFTNLLEYWLGRVISFKVISVGKTQGSLDSEPDVQLSFADCTVTLLAARKENFSFHEIDLISPNGRLRYQQGGTKITWQQAVPDPLFEGYNVLSQTEEEIPSESERAQWHVADQLAACLNGCTSDLCSGVDALQSLELLTKIRAAS
ncbi:MAG: Gfo/Idh/MocA family oxidoreductase [Cohaesibacteraceae bacterium]|nr:Gfo/Idh/MocA family oxidoreductase [Cohaesibacteraceae bacterium]